MVAALFFTRVDQNSCVCDKQEDKLKAGNYDCSILIFYSHVALSFTANSL